MKRLFAVSLLVLIQMVSAWQQQYLCPIDSTYVTSCRDNCTDAPYGLYCAYNCDSTGVTSTTGAICVTECAVNDHYVSESNICMSSCSGYTYNGVCYSDSCPSNATYKEADTSNPIQCLSSCSGYRYDGVCYSDGCPGGTYYDTTSKTCKKKSINPGL